MIRLAHREDCCGCTACAAVCAHGAIRMKQDAMGFPYPEIDPLLCTECGLCERVCAFKPIQAGATLQPQAIRFPEFLDRSQSGGLAYAVMRKAITEGYIVYGAALDEDFVVRHRRVDSLEGLEPLRLSKYVQSDMEGIPAQVLADLKAGRQVLFSGTPCQCAGIGSLCARHRERLLLMDLICHGVPAPSVWKDYLDWAQKRQGAQLTGALFRDPSLGWRGSKERLFFGEKSVVSNVYNYFYFKGLMYRPSCGSCPFASLHRPSDITVGDFWGVDKALPGFADDNRGCSLLLASTEAGSRFCEQFPDAHTRASITVEQALQMNLQRPTRPHRYARLFEKLYLRKGFPTVFRLMGPDSLNHRIALFMHKRKQKNG